MRTTPEKTAASEPERSPRAMRRMASMGTLSCQGT
jgi:hypothetical protein